MPRLKNIRMLIIGLIREGKIPPDNRVALTPAQCKWVQQNLMISIKVQQCEIRCFKDKEYEEAGIEVNEDVSDCDVLLGIKEVPVDMLIPGKTYLFFSHTKKMQPYNQKLLQSIISKRWNPHNWFWVFCRCGWSSQWYDGVWQQNRRT